ncbi:energy transducer TonB [Rhodocyclus tenuis]|uniref:Protein TonB n=1 Tax=Rhodocyclus tenuis TaxID=1066 RepID=A0A840G004_RHOTE|nr:energy transducer TonB [Rhodocyclus tenuis]MBB4247717.1 protein TonB [Rhodocyclus tenuis]
MSRNAARRPLGVAVVVVAHGVLLAVLWQLQAHAPQSEPELPLFAQLIAPPPPTVSPQEAARPARQAEARPRVSPPVQLAAATEFASVPAVGVSPTVQETASVPPAAVTGPITLSGELSVVCPERPAPDYPVTSRRIGEQGRTVLRVELDSDGRVADVRIAVSSGSERLDNAALNALRRWRCQPARRDGSAVRAIALQPFDFVLRSR